VAQTDRPTWLAEGRVGGGPDEQLAGHAPAVKAIEEEKPTRVNPISTGGTGEGGTTWT
jgi:hypothetical protein